MVRRGPIGYLAQIHRPPSYTALRFDAALYVQYDNPKRPPEYYEHGTDPYERRNIWPYLEPERQAKLAEQLERMKTCSAASCRMADQGRRIHASSPTARAVAGNGSRRWTRTVSAVM